MNKISKRILSLMLMALVIASTLTIPSATAQAKGVTDAQLKKAMNCYLKILKTNPYEDMEGGFTAETFRLQDLDRDGIPELIINGEAPQIFSYNVKNDKVMFIYNSWTYCTLYYSSSTKNILYKSEWRGKIDYIFSKVNDTQTTDEYSVIESLKETYTYTDGKYDEYDTYKPKKGYYKGYYGSEDAKLISKKTLDAVIKKLVPDKFELKTTLKNNTENQKKYLADLKTFKKYAAK